MREADRRDYWMTRQAKTTKTEEVAETAAPVQHTPGDFARLLFRYRPAEAARLCGLDEARAADLLHDEGFRAELARMEAWHEETTRRLAAGATLAAVERLLTELESPESKADAKASLEVLKLAGIYGAAAGDETDEGWDGVLRRLQEGPDAVDPA
jgi:hypothetical protein